MVLKTSSARIQRARIIMIAAAFSVALLVSFSGEKTVRAQPAKPPSAEDQVNATAHDVEITRKIRSSLTSNKKFSVAAQNVTIVTLQGNVTLRGMVPTLDEKKKIAEVAQMISGRKVDDQLQVKEPRHGK